jgi:FMN-dependent NADH-azoreductase
MATLLMVNSSPRVNSVSSSLTRRLIERNLAESQIPFMNEAWITAAYTPETQRSAAQRDLLALSDQLIDEVMVADVVLLGIPMHNFSVPAAFKSWIDNIARVGKTFSYSDRGPIGLVPAGKQVVSVISRGGAAPVEPAAGHDHMVSYLRQVLSLVGLNDVTFVNADRQSFGGEASAQSLALATQQIDRLARGGASQLAA